MRFDKRKFMKNSNEVKKMEFKKIKVKRGHRHYSVEINPEFARIHAHLCGDGSLYTSRKKRSKKELFAHPRKNLIRKLWFTNYTNTNEVLVKQFISDVKNVLKRKVVKVQKFGYEVQNKWVFELFRKLGVLNSHSWYIPCEILSASNDVKIEWLKAFFDDEVM